MSNESSNDKIIFHASSTGRLYIKGGEFFKSKKVKSMILKLKESSIYKHLKAENPKLTTP
ncbi:hypothetical protein WSM22_02450 [Cytophagales bacterium WSM2-2]|nr:hypothetical protein WSM22_02450 [Cytophagales bacterium WSM2-2]